MKTRRSLRTLLKSTAAGAALACAPGVASAADCFDKDTDDPKAGNATAIIGPAVGRKRLDADAFTRPAVGDDMFGGDRVRTGDASHLQLKLCDWSTYTFPPQSESDIDEFYDADGVSRRRVVNFVRGGFRFASGRSTKPGATQVKFQDSGVTMGVRGTNVIIAEVDGVTYALLEGPSQDNSGLARQGQIVFWEGDNPNEITARLLRPGFAVTVGPDGVSRPFRADADLLRRIYQTFTPAPGVATAADTSDGGYSGDPEQDSGLDAQAAGVTTASVEQTGETEDATTDNQPERPAEMGMDMMMAELSLAALDSFAASQANPKGFVSAVSSAQVFVDDGSGEVLADEGVALVQLEVDWANRTLAPDAFSSFVQFDFSVSDPTDLTVDDVDFFIPPEVAAALAANGGLASLAFPFENGVNGAAQFINGPLTFSFVNGENGAVVANVLNEVLLTDANGVQYRFVTSADGLNLGEGGGDLTFSDVPLAFVLSPEELDALNPRTVARVAGAGGGIPASQTGVTTLTGFSGDNGVALADGTALNGVSFAQLQIDFNNRTVGGGDSFIVVSAPLGAGPSSTPVQAGEILLLNNPVSFDDGLLDLTIFSFSQLAATGGFQNGQAVVAQDEGEGILIGQIAGTLDTDEGVALSTFIDLADSGVTLAPVLSVTDFVGLADADAALTGRFDSALSPRGGAPSALVDGVLLFGSAVEGAALIEVDFSNRTVGGGDSFVSLNIPTASIAFNEAITQVSFDEGLSGLGVFAFGPGGTNSALTSAILIARNQGDGLSDTTADLIFRFDVNGVDGSAQLADLPFEIDDVEEVLAPGDILPLDVLDAFAASQVDQFASVFGLAPAILTEDLGSGEMVVDEGVAFVQIEVDWANRALAPRPFTSFVSFDFSVSDPNDLTVRDFDFSPPSDVQQAFQAQFGPGGFINGNAAGGIVPFANGLDGLAVIPADAFTFTFRQGDTTDTATLDIDIFSEESSTNGSVFTLSTALDSLDLQPGFGDFFAFDFQLGNALSIAEADSFLAGLSITSFTGFGANLFFDAAGNQSGGGALAFAQIEIDPAARTVGGGSSFIATTAAFSGGERVNGLVRLNTPTSFDEGLFGITFFPITSLTDDPGVTSGQFIFGGGEGFFGDVRIAFEAEVDDTGDPFNVVFIVPVTGDVDPASPIATIADFEAAAAASGFTSGVYSSANGASTNFASLQPANSAFVIGSSQFDIEIDFANRTVGGGDSFLSVSLQSGDLVFNTGIGAVSFDNGARDSGVFGFGVNDFSNPLFQTGLLQLRSDQSAGDVADFFFNFSDGNGGVGNGRVEDVPFMAFGDNMAIPGDILSLEQLDTFAQQVANPDGHIFGIAQAQLFEDLGSGEMLVDEGVALIQIEVDWGNRLVAPRAGGSFVQFDFSVNDPTNLTVENPNPFVLNADVLEAAYFSALQTSAGISFDDGDAGNAIFMSPLFELNIVQGDTPDVVTGVVFTELAETEQNGTTNRVTATISELEFQEGRGDLALSVNSFLSEVLSTSEFASFSGAASRVLSSSSFFQLDELVFANVDGQATTIPGVTVARIDVDFGNQTIGGPGSFIAVHSGDGPNGISDIIFLDSPVSGASGLFGLSLFPLTSLTSDTQLRQGQTSVAFDGELFFGDVAAIIENDTGSEFFTNVLLTEGFNNDALPATTIAALDAQTNAITTAFDTSFFRLESLTANSGEGAAIFDNGVDVFFGTAEASVDVNFANRSIGGGNSFVGVNIVDFQNQQVIVDFMETLNEVSFDTAIDGSGAFGLGAGDFSGSNVEAAILLLRDGGGPTGAGAGATLDFTFTDGMGNEGRAQINDLTRTPGLTSSGNDQF